MNVPIRSNGEIDFPTLEGNARNYVVTNPLENVFSFDANESELKELVNYFGSSDDLNFSYNPNGGKYEVKLSAKI